jgi:hypothetical protein
MNTNQFVFISKHLPNKVGRPIQFCKYLLINTNQNMYIKVPKTLKKLVFVEERHVKISYHYFYVNARTLLMHFMIVDCPNYRVWLNSFEILCSNLIFENTHVLLIATKSLCMYEINMF